MLNMFNNVYSINQDSVNFLEVGIYDWKQMFDA